MDFLDMINADVDLTNSDSELDLTVDLTQDTVKPLSSVDKVTVKLAQEPTLLPPVQSSTEEVQEGETDVLLTGC
jgi:hypothetical protein